MCVNFFFFFNDTATTEIYTLSLHDALPISGERQLEPLRRCRDARRHDHGIPEPRLRCRSGGAQVDRSEEHTSELQSRQYLVCRLLLEKKKKNKQTRSLLSSETKKHMSRVVI